MIDNNEPAFPCDSFQDKGMTLRDWFAGQALVGLCAGDNVYIPKGCQWGETMAKTAYEFADAMMEARKKSE